MKKLLLFASFMIAVVMTGCQQGSQETATEETDTTGAAVTPADEAAEDSEGEWISLFDGENATGWRSYNGDSLPDGWVVEEGTLKSLGHGGDIGGDIVYGDREFDNFELSLEWKISEGGNSGIFYHVQEGDQYEAPYYTAPEYQIIDDKGFAEPLEDWQSLGADYAMYVADPEKKIVKPAGEWNTSRIVFTEDNAEYWLNGEMVLSFDPWSEDWNNRKESGKWKDFPDYGTSKTGLIGLQDHGSEIWFKNIRIREL